MRIKKISLNIYLIINIGFLACNGTKNNSKSMYSIFKKDDKKEISFKIIPINNNKAFSCEFNQFKQPFIVELFEEKNINWRTWIMKELKAYSNSRGYWKKLINDSEIPLNHLSIMFNLLNHDQLYNKLDHNIENINISFTNQVENRNIPTKYIIKYHNIINREIFLLSLSIKKTPFKEYLFIRVPYKEVNWGWYDNKENKYKLFTKNDTSQL